MSEPNPYSPSPGLENSPGATALSTIDFELTEKDYIAFNIFVYKSRGLYRRYMVLFTLLVLGIVAVLTLGVITGDEESSVLDILPFAVVMLLAVPLLPWLMKRSIRHSVKVMLKGTSARALFGRHTLSITPESVIKKNEYQYSELKWLIIDKLEMTDDYLYIMPTGVSAHIVPREAFQSDGEYRGFCELARGYFETSRAEAD